MKTFILIFIIFFSFNLSAQDNNIVWDKDNQLSWEKFKGSVPKGTEMVAKTSSEIKMHYHNVGNDSLFISVKAKYYSLDSWAKKSMVNGYLLNHEQRHFDITELFARKLRKELLNGHFLVSKITYELEIIRKEIIKQAYDEQARYDKETDHSTKREVQDKWNKYIDEQLKALESYKNTEIMIKIEY